MHESPVAQQVPPQLKCPALQQMGSVRLVWSLRHESAAGQHRSPHDASPAGPDATQTIGQEAGRAAEGDPHG